MPTDNKAVGTGNPPADMNAVIDALAASGVTYNVLNAAYAGGADPTGAADSTAAFAACMAAAIAAPSGEMIIPPGSYTLNTGGLHITGPFRMRGLGAGLSNQNGTTVTPAVTLNSNTSGNLFDFPFQGFLWGGLEIENVSVNFTGSGNVFSGCNITDSVFRNMNITLTGTSSMAIVTSGSVSY